MTSDDLKPGLAGTRTLRINEGLTVPALAPATFGFSDMPPVFATAFLVAFVEWTCIEVLRPYLAAGQRTVGVRVDLSHTAALLSAWKRRPKSNSSSAPIGSSASGSWCATRQS